VVEEAVEALVDTVTVLDSLLLSLTMTTVEMFFYKQSVEMLMQFLNLLLLFIVMLLKFNQHFVQLAAQ
jgi:hypothetical protein